MSVVHRGNSALDDWYANVEGIPIEDLEPGDLCRAIRQELCLDHTVPIALQHAKLDPFAGGLFDGEIVSVLARIRRTFWEQHQDLLVTATQVLAGASPLMDAEVADEVQVFLKTVDGISRTEVDANGVDAS